jgi:anti-sigma regulatory factor (Ser/Thr protein kinase)
MRLHMHNLTATIVLYRTTHPTRGDPDASMSGREPRGVVPAPPSWQEAVVCDDWPRQDVLQLGPLPGAVPCARLHARHILREWGLADLAGDVELLISELMTNAVTASRSAGEPTPVWMWLLADSARVLIMVWDASEQVPIPTGVGPGQDAENVLIRGFDADAESGRGLLLVQSISQQWDWYRTQHEAGKVVWALVQSNSHYLDGKT